MIYKSSILFYVIYFCLNIVNASVIDIGHPEESLNKFNYSSYNQLKTVEEADSILQDSQDFHKFLTKARTLAQNYDVADILGLRLAHRHTELFENQKMVEGYEVWEGKKCLVTRPSNVDFDIKATPSSWIIGKNGYEVFEYSTDPNVKSSFNKILLIPEIFTELHKLLKKYHLQYIVVPAILDREWRADFQNFQSINFVEESYYEPSFASVVKAIKELEPRENLEPITTVWFLYDKPLTYGGCYEQYSCYSERGKYGHTRIKVGHYSL